MDLEDVYEQFYTTLRGCCRGSCNLDWYAVCAVRSMARTASGVARSPKFKHLQAGNIVAT